MQRVYRYSANEEKKRENIFKQNFVCIYYHGEGMRLSLRNKRRLEILI